VQQVSAAIQRLKKAYFLLLLGLPTFRFFFGGGGMRNYGNSAVKLENDQINKAKV
jgi:hypothetical protein